MGDNHSKNGVFTASRETLTNDYFVNLLDVDSAWKETSEEETEFEGRDRKTGDVRWIGLRVNLILVQTQNSEQLLKFTAAMMLKKSLFKISQKRGIKL